MTKFFTRLLGLTTMLMLVASVASAFTHFPNATCPDSVTIRRLYAPITAQDSLCQPKPNGSTAGDTISGMGGVIVAFDPIPTGFDIYLENSNGAAYNGVDVFTGGTNYQTAYSLSLADSIVVEFACVALYNNDLEVLAPTGKTVIVRRVGAATLPPYLVGTTTTLNCRATGGSVINKYNGQLVYCNGPLTVARTVGLGTNNFLCVSASSPSDSIQVDGAKLTTYGSPALGTAIDWVRGCALGINRNSGAGAGAAQAAFKIMLRDGNDIATSTPPNVGDVYPIDDNNVRVTFDRSVTSATATNVNNYSLGSFGTVNSIVMDGTSAVVVNITNGLNHGDTETMSVNGVAGSANGLAMTSVQSKTFINGLLTCYELQQPNPDSLIASPCIEKSRFAGGGGQTSQGSNGPRISMSGICTAKYQGTSNATYYFQDADNLANQGGMTIYAPTIAPVVGRKYFISGFTMGYYGETEVQGISDTRDLGLAAVPAPKVQTIAVLSKDICDSLKTIVEGRDYMSQLVKLNYVKVVQRFNPLPTNGFHVAGPNPTYTDTMFVENLQSALGTNGVSDYPAIGTVLDVVGCLHYSNSSYRVCPRNQADIAIHGNNVGVNPGMGKLAFSVFPNPARNAKVAYTLPVASDVEVGVYDVLGRQVAQLAKGRQAAGSYQTSWNGRDAAGKQVGSGVYFYRLRAGSETRTTRAILLGN